MTEPKGAGPGPGTHGERLSATGSGQIAQAGTAAGSDAVAGSGETSGTGSEAGHRAAAGSGTGEGRGATGGPREARALKCNNCGAPIELRAAGHVETVACGACGAVLDARDPGLALIKTCEKHVAIPSRIPLGNKGTLRGEVLQAIGFMRREIVVEGVHYGWDEFLLFNPYKGFRWLTHYEGHWSLIKDCKSTPVLKRAGDKPVYRVLDMDFAHFQTATARVTYVLGEFYWTVAVGESAQVRDFVCPPFMLSEERTAKEVTYSLGEYVDGQDVWKAFGLPGQPPPRKGVGATQPSWAQAMLGPIGKRFAALALLAIALECFFGCTTQRTEVFRQGFTYRSTEPEKSKVSDLFTLAARPHNLVIHTMAPVDNNWIDVDYALINVDTGDALDFGREVSYYHGVEDGEAWTEGGREDEVVLPGPPAGKYYLRVEPQSSLGTVDYTVAVYRDATQAWPLFAALLVLGLPLLVLVFLQQRFEINRWAESDHPIVTQSDD